VKLTEEMAEEAMKKEFCDNEKTVM